MLSDDGFCVSVPSPLLGPSCPGIREGPSLLSMPLPLPWGDRVTLFRAWYRWRRSDRERDRRPLLRPVCVAGSVGGQFSVEVDVGEVSLLSLSLVRAQVPALRISSRGRRRW